MKLLIGGSPCTHWSIAQTKNRETEPKGLGWELFENYLIALGDLNPSASIPPWYPPRTASGSIGAESAIMMGPIAPYLSSSRRIVESCSGTSWDPEWLGEKRTTRSRPTTLKPRR